MGEVESRHMGRRLKGRINTALWERGRADMQLMQSQKQMQPEM